MIVQTSFSQNIPTMNYDNKNKNQIRCLITKDIFCLCIMYIKVIMLHFVDN